MDTAPTTGVSPEKKAAKIRNNIPETAGTKIMFKDNVGAIIIGGHFQGLGLIRSLSEMGIPTILIDHAPCIARHSRYINHFYRCPDVADPVSFISYLKNLSSRHSLEGWVLFPTDDETVAVLSQNHKELNGVFRLTTPSWDIIQNVHLKKNTYQLAETLHIPIPKTFYPDSIEDLRNIKCKYPVIIKPSVMRPFFKKTGSKVFKADNESKLLERYKQACNIINTEDILIQEIIPDACDNLYSFCPMFKDRKIFARIIAKRCRQHPHDFGHASTYVKTVALPELELLSHKFLAAINYYGLCEVEFVYDHREKQYKLLEINPRIWGWHTLAKKAGVNLPYMVFQDTLGIEIRKEHYEVGMKWLRMVTDIPTCLTGIIQGRLKWRDWYDSLTGQKEFAVFSLKDPAPALAEIFMLPYLWVQRGF